MRSTPLSEAVAVESADQQTPAVVPAIHIDSSPQSESSVPVDSLRQRNTPLDHSNDQAPINSRLPSHRDDSSSPALPGQHSRSEIQAPDAGVSAPANTTAPIEPKHLHAVGDKQSKPTRDSEVPSTRPPDSSYWHRFAKSVGLNPLPWYITWIGPCLTWAKLKPVLRSAIVAWICMLLLLITSSEIALGSASFLVLIGAFIQPAEVPLVAVMEREFFTLLFACASWTWAIIAIAISSSVRRNKLTPAQTDLARVINGDYIEARVSIVCAVFLSIGSAVLLYTKVRFGPGPFLFATVLSCILLNICLTFAPLYPYPFYMLGQAVVVPLAVKAAINVIVSFFFFPKSVNSQFAERLIAVLSPLALACGEQPKLLQTSPLDTPSSSDDDKKNKEGFQFSLVKDKLTAAESGLMPLAMSARLLTREISFGLASGEDLKTLERLARALIAPADGWSYYYSSIRADISSAHFPKTPVPSRLATPLMSPLATPRTSGEHVRDLDDASRSHPLASVRDLHPMNANSGSSTPRRDSPLHEHVNTDPAAAASSAVSFRQLDEHPSVQPGDETSSSRFRRMARSIATPSRSSSPRRWIHHHNHSQHDHHYNAQHHDVHSSIHGVATPGHRLPWDRSAQLIQHIMHKREIAPVAIWESIRFGNLETYLHTPAANYITEMFAQLLRETSSDLLSVNATAIRHLISWLTDLNSQRYSFLRERLMTSRDAQEEKGRGRAEKTREMIASVEKELHEFRTIKRLLVLDPYREAFDARADSTGYDAAADFDLRTGPGEIGKIHHRYLYQAWLHQFHTICFTEKLLGLLRGVETIQSQRTVAKLWFPRGPRIFSIEAWKSIGGGDDQDEGQPEGEADHIPDIMNDAPTPTRRRSRSQTESSQSTKQDEENNDAQKAHFESDSDAATSSDPIVDLGSAKARDPDAMDPEGPLEVLGHRIYHWTRRPFHGNFLFGMKAAVLIALVSLPAYMKSSAGWCYENRAIWAIFMAQLTLARFRGETAFALFSRILATIIGAVVGLVIWYISTGSGHGNAYGLGVTTAIAFPMLMMFRLYFPGPPITPIISTVTVGLIVGYSWKDVNNPSPGSPGFGWSVAWRRFVAVVIGVSAAYIFSYLPPSSTLREYQRLSHAATIAELGKVYCSVVSIASGPHQQHDEPSKTIKGANNSDEVDLRNRHPSSEAVQKRLIAIRVKLRRLSMISVNVSYEFSLRGRWPEARYKQLFTIQLEISKLLSHCLTVLEKLGPAYSIALLRRTRFLDPRFLGDVVSVISMCSTALKTAEPLPQITACPLLDRFVETPHGFNAYLPDPYSSHTPVADTERLDPSHHHAHHQRHHHHHHHHHPHHHTGGATTPNHGNWEELVETLPKRITLATLQDSEYMNFSVGVTTLFGLVVRIDKLCVAVKELVGESFAVPVDVHRTMVTRSAYGHHTHS